jgi:hypothetical protein
MLSASIWLIFLQKGFEPAKPGNLPAKAKKAKIRANRGNSFEKII